MHSLDPLNSDTDKGTNTLSSGSDCMTEPSFLLQALCVGHVPSNHDQPMAASLGRHGRPSPTLLGEHEAEWLTALWP